MSDSRLQSIDLFFFVKGSKDYPVGYPVSDKFGFDALDSSGSGVTSELPIFSYSLKDLYTKLNEAKVIENIYSLDLPAEYKIPNSQYSVNPEYLSTLIINNGNEEVYKNINPNYTGSMNDENEETNSTHRENEFWQKMFTLFEFLKYKEKEMATSDELVSGSFGYDESNYSSGSLALINAESNIAGKLIMLFIANSKKLTPAPSKNPEDIRKFREYYVRERSAEDQYKGSRSELWETLNIDYVEKSASLHISKFTGRIDSLSFSLTYTDDAALSGSTSMTWTFNLFFTPDAIIDSLGGSKYKVYTYNDIDFDNQYESVGEGFNPYDNDYANTLNKDENVKGKFIVSKQEVNKRIMNELLEIMKEGTYQKYVEFNTRRVIPFITQNDEDGLKYVSWENPEAPTANQVTQTFYVFYSSSTPPSTVEQQDAVRTYLRNLHKSCSPQTTDEHGNVVFIGHGNTNEDINIFLSKMYPDLFSQTSLFIIPALSTRYIGSGVDIQNQFNPMKYIHPVALGDIYSAIVSVPELKTTKFDPEGNISSDGVHNAFEIFYLGGSLEDNYIKFDMPFICLQKDSSEKYPLTSITGFNQYKQKIFNGSDTTSRQYDIVQFILLKLFEKAFQNTANDSINKGRYTVISGVPINYRYDGTYDSSLKEKGVVNIAEFAILGITFVVYCQLGKNFGSATKVDESQSVAATE